MRSSLVLSVLSAVGCFASPLDFPRLEERAVCKADDCLRGLKSRSANALSFCSSTLGLSAVTSTVYVTQTATVTSVETDIATVIATNVATQTISSYTQVYTTAVMKRAQNADSTTSALISKCGSSPSKISSACGCFLSSVPASTVTSSSTVTVTSTIPTTTTSSTTTTTQVTTQVTTLVTSTLTTTTTTSAAVATPIISNPSFDSYPSNPGSNWTAVDNSGGSHSYVQLPQYPSRNYVYRCHTLGSPFSTGICDLSQAFTLPDPTVYYAISFDYRIDAASDAATYIQPYVGGNSQSYVNDATPDWKTYVTGAFTGQQSSLKVEIFTTGGINPNAVETTYIDNVQIYTVPAPND